MIDDAGKVQLLRLIKGLPLGLDRQALEAVGRWRFEPATLRGRPVQVLYNLQIHFRLE
jgi:TonB family protein